MESCQPTSPKTISRSQTLKCDLLICLLAPRTRPARGVAQRQLGMVLKAGYLGILESEYRPALNGTLYHPAATGLSGKVQVETTATHSGSPGHRMCAWSGSTVEMHIPVALHELSVKRAGTVGEIGMPVALRGLARVASVPG